MTSALMPTFFRLLNFGIIIGAGIYVYRRFGRKLLQEMFERYEEHKQLLRNEIVSLNAHTEDVKKAFAVQNALGVRLADNIEQWQLSVARAIALRQHEKEALTTMLQRKAERVAHHAAWVSLRRECLDAAVKEATESLTAFYTDQAHVQDYLGTVLSRLHEHPLKKTDTKELSLEEKSLDEKSLDEKSLKERSLKERA